MSLLLSTVLLPLSIPFPALDPIAIELGPIAVKWYGLAYMAGLLLGWLYIKRLLDTPPLWPNGAAPFASSRAEETAHHEVAEIEPHHRRVLHRQRQRDAAIVPRAFVETEPLHGSSKPAECSLRLLD